MSQLVFASELENIKLIDDFITRLKKHYQIDPPKFVDIRLSIMEAVNNAIIHGNQLDASKMVIISEKVVDDYLVVQIEDQGRGFDPSAVQDPTSKLDLSLPGGRGIHLMRHLTDKVDFIKNGQSVVLRFKL
ncbi:ATP-binding protein [Membranicola marinus]|uniref:ATP-binding protein n=1 Tax=Membranihabitans marinus TaxID=1227546 RepID=A0A953HTI5_9BACT|nr:ATP-binding protein [Membranihabitans marinus]MBY5958145.1 ATP-binding protein [Membranihabitans marinus]